MRSRKTACFSEPFKTNGSFVGHEMERAPRECAEAVRESVIPATSRFFLKFMRDEYIPGARHEPCGGVAAGRKGLYRSKILEFTTLDLDPLRSTRRGLRKSRASMPRWEKAMRASGFKGGFPGVPENFCVAIRDSTQKRRRNC